MESDCNKVYRVLQGTGCYNILQGTGLYYWGTLGEGVHGGTVATAKVQEGTREYLGYWGVIGGPGGYSMVLQVQWGTVGY